MRKYVIGGLIGASLMLSFNVSAAVESIIGRQIEGTAAVKLNGQKLDTDSIIVDGSSYAPVRVIGESLGLEVGFKGGEVILTEKETDKKMPQIQTGPVTLEEYEAVIKSRKDKVPMLEQQLKELKGRSPDDTDRIKELEDKIQAYKDETEELEKQKAALNK